MSYVRARASFGSLAALPRLSLAWTMPQSMVAMREGPEVRRCGDSFTERLHGLGSWTRRTLLQAWRGCFAPTVSFCCCRLHVTVRRGVLSAGFLKQAVCQPFSCRGKLAAKFTDMPQQSFTECDSSPFEFVSAGIRVCAHPWRRRDRANHRQFDLILVRASFAITVVRRQ